MWHRCAPHGGMRDVNMTFLGNKRERKKSETNFFFFKFLHVSRRSKWSSRCIWIFSYPDPHRRFCAMSVPTTTPVSKVIPASNHFFKFSCVFLLSAAASFPKISAKRSCAHTQNSLEWDYINQYILWKHDHIYKRVIINMDTFKKIWITWNKQLPQPHQ